jgi:hypothetical protein
MTYLAVADFKRGMSRIRPQVVGEPGSLWNAKNCVLSRGGDIESQKKWVGEFALPAGTFGLASNKGQPIVFGTGATPGGMPSAVSYKQLTYTGVATLSKVHDAKPFAGKLYVIAEFDDGDIRHFYDGVEVAEWRTRADGLWDYTTVARVLAQKINERSDVSAIVIDNRVIVTAAVQGTGFTITTGTNDNANVAGSLPTAVKTTLAANVAGVAEVRATATVTITGGSPSIGVNQVSQIAVGVNNLLTAPVNFVLDNSATANAVALAITSAAVAGYTATAVGNVITILAPPGLGATINGTAEVVTSIGDVTTSQTSFAGGVTAVAAVTQVEQVTISATATDTLDQWTITINGTAYKSNGRASATGKLIHVILRRLWIPVGPYLCYCKLSVPTVWTTTAAPATDPGFIDTTLDTEGSEDITAIGEHNGNTVIFSDTSLRVYNLDTDATKIALLQYVDNAGSIITKAAVQYENADLFFVSLTGLTALRSRLGSNYSHTVDVASAIAPFLQDYITLVGDSVTRNGQACMEPRDGRFMLCISSRVFVYNAFVDSGVSGWTYMDLAFTPDQFLRVGRRIMARAGNTIYVYGGIGGNTYPAAGETTVDFETGFLASNDPGDKKSDQEYGSASVGDWTVTVRVDPNNTAAVVRVGVVNKITYPKVSGINFPAYTSHAALHATCASGGKVTFSSFLLGFNRAS